MKDSIFKCAINNRWKVVIFFIFISFFSIPLTMKVKVNFDMNSYLPSDSPSSVALDRMQEEFEGGIPNARVMVENVTIEQAFLMEYSLMNVDGVEAVSWMDDPIKLDMSDLSSLMQISMDDFLTDIENQSMIENYYKDNTAIYSLTIDEEKAIDAVRDIRKIIKENGAITGNAVAISDATTSTVKEVALSSIISVLLVIFILIITTDYWLEPFVILTGLGIAILINAGTNIIFGEISFVTNAAGSILQLAVSLDYSVFLFHRFNEARANTDNEKDAMLFALKKSWASITSSGLTTVIGFLALALMRFKIGPDLGLALAKGVGLSLITVFVFMPAFFLVTLKIVDKTKHKRLLPQFTNFGAVVSKIAIPLSLLFALTIVPAFICSNKNSFYYGADHMFNSSSVLGRDTKAIEDIFGKNDTYILMLPSGTDGEKKQLVQELSSKEEVTYIFTAESFAEMGIPDEYFNEEIISQMKSENFDRVLVGVSLPAEGDDTFDFVREIRAITEKYYPDGSYIAGAGVTTYDLMDTITSDMVKVNLIAVAAVFVILLISMKSIVLPIVLVLSIELAIWLNLSVPFVMGDSVFYVAYLIISAIQLGATVDYAILMADRYKEKRKQFAKKDAVKNTISEVTVPIMTSGMALVIVGFLEGILCTNQLLAQLGVFIGRGAVLSLCIVFCVLPGYLMIVDKS